MNNNLKEILIIILILVGVVVAAMGLGFLSVHLGAGNICSGPARYMKQFILFCSLR